MFGHLQKELCLQVMVLQVMKTLQEKMMRVSMTIGLMEQVLAAPNTCSVIALYLEYKRSANQDDVHGSRNLDRYGSDGN